MDHSSRWLNLKKHPEKKKGALFSFKEKRQKYDINTFKKKKKKKNPTDWMENGMLVGSSQEDEAEVQKLALLRSCPSPTLHLHRRPSICGALISIIYYHKEQPTFSSPSSLIPFLFCPSALRAESKKCKFKFSNSAFELYFSIFWSFFHLGFAQFWFLMTFSFCPELLIHTKMDWLGYIQCTCWLWLKYRCLRKCRDLVNENVAKL